MPKTNKILLPEDVIDAMWHCQMVAENNDSSLGDYNFKHYDRLRRFLEEECDYAE